MPKGRHDSVIIDPSMMLVVGDRLHHQFSYFHVTLREQTLVLPRA